MFTLDNAFDRTEINSWYATRDPQYTIYNLTQPAFRGFFRESAGLPLAWLWDPEKGDLVWTDKSPTLRTVGRQVCRYLMRRVQAESHTQQSQ